MFYCPHVKPSYLVHPQGTMNVSSWAQTEPRLIRRLSEGLFTGAGGNSPTWADPPHPHKEAEVLHLSSPPRLPLGLTKAPVVFRTGCQIPPGSCQSQTPTLTPSRTQGRSWCINMQLSVLGPFLQDWT